MRAMQIAIFTTGGTIDKVYFDAKGGYDNLTMDVTAKTYRYIEDEGNSHPAKKKTGGAT